jgi:hypothetical protein
MINKALHLREPIDGHCSISVVAGHVDQLLGADGVREQQQISIATNAHHV